MASNPGHLEKNNSNNTRLRDVVIGMSDGLTIPFALSAGLSVAVESTGIIVMAGMAEIAAGSIAMAMSGYFSVRSEQKHHQEKLKKEYGELTDETNVGKYNTKEFFANLGLSEQLQVQASQEIEKDKEKWIAFMANYEGLLPADNSKLKRSAWTIGMAYVAGGIVPIAPYFILENPMTALKFASIITLISLFILGWFKGKITGINTLGSAVRITLFSAAAAAAAYGVARIFVAA